MMRFGPAAVLTAALLAVGCASAPERRADADRAEVPATAAAPNAAAGDAGAEVVPNLVVDARDPAPGSAVTCREILKQGSNVIVTQCMTRDDWDRFERRQALEAREIVRTLQGGAYR